MNTRTRLIGAALAGLFALTACEGASLADGAASPGGVSPGSTSLDDPGDWLGDGGDPGWFVFAARTVAHAPPTPMAWELDAWSAAHRGLSLDELLELMNVRVAAPVDRCVHETPAARSWAHLRDAVVSFQSMDLAVVRPDGNAIDLEPRRVSSAGGVARGVVYAARLAGHDAPDRLTLAVGERFAAPDLPLPVPLVFHAVDGVPVGDAGLAAVGVNAVRDGLYIEVVAVPRARRHPAGADGATDDALDATASDGWGGVSGDDAPVVNEGVRRRGRHAAAGAVTELLVPSPTGGRWVCGVDGVGGVDVPSAVLEDVRGVGRPVTLTLRSSHVVPVTDASGLVGVAVAESIDHLVLTFDPRERASGSR